MTPNPEETPKPEENKKTPETGATDDQLSTLAETVAPVEGDDNGKGEKKEEVKDESNQTLNEHGEQVGDELTSLNENAGQIHKDHDELMGNAEIKTKLEEDRKKLGGTDVKDVRYNHRLLVEKEGDEDPETRISNLKQETARRIAAYTDAGENGWRVLNYRKVGGHEHEMGIGLGDILLDTDIEEILVEKNGSTIKGIRGVTTGGRQAFLDENGRYIATFDGDKFKILSNTRADKDKYIEKLDREISIRSEHKKQYEDYEQIQGSFDQGEDKMFPYVKLKEGQSVVSQIIHQLNGQQKQMAEIIEDEFTKAGIHPGIIAAAIVNAYHESGLNPTIQSGCVSSSGVREDSWGLFQINVGARTRDPQSAAALRERAKDPRENCKILLKEIQSPRWGSSLKAAAESGASVATLAAIFARDIERPGDKAKAMKMRAASAAKFFGTSERPPDLQPALSSNDGERATEGIERSATGITHKKYKEGNRRRYLCEVIDIEKGDETLIIGSSTVVGQYNKHRGTGVYGFSGFGSDGFLNQFQNDVWQHMEANPDLIPKKIVIAGLAVNDITKGQSVSSIISRHQAMVDFFKSKGIEVKVATIQPVYPKKHPENIAKVSQFNNWVRSTMGKDTIDLYSAVANSDGTWQSGKTRDGIHADSGLVERLIAQA